MRYAHVLCLLMLLPAGTAAQSLQTAIDNIVDTPTLQNAWWGILAIDLSTGAVLYSRNSERSFIPASNTKLFTTAAALEQLGPDFTYRTELFIDGLVRDGELHGDLLVRGSGDPTIGSEHQNGERTALFRAWADSLRNVGITHIRGNLVGDDDIFDDTPFGEGWSWDDELYGYAAPISGLAFHDNVIKVTLSPRAVGNPAYVSWEPHQTDYVSMVNSSITIAAGSRLEEEYERPRGTNTITLASKVPRGRRDTELLSVDNPTLFFVHVLREILLQEGITVNGNPVDVDDLDTKPAYASTRYQRIAVHHSPPLARLVETINKESQNLYAEHLLRTVGTRHDEDDAALSLAERGIKASMTTYATAGVDTSRLQLADGSGLSRKNLVTPTMTMAILRYMANHENAAIRDAFRASLAVGGQDGTLSHRFSQQHAPIQAKTGTLGNVSALSGYVNGNIAFVLLCNHYTARGHRTIVRKAQDAIVLQLATQ